MKNNKFLGAEEYMGKNIIHYKGKELQICTRCIYDETVRGISFDEEGVCSLCHTSENLKAQYKTGTSEGEKMLMDILADVKKAGKNKKYDCVVGFSGGTDSSYMVAKLVEWGLRPLAVTYDNTWNTDIAVRNISKIIEKLNVDIETYTVDAKEIDDIFSSFLKAGVPELEACTDLAIAEILYRAASKHKVKYIMEGHSFITEGISPIGSMYFDGAYIKDIHKKFGVVKMKTYPLMNFTAFMKWILFKRIKKIRPYWYMPVKKEEAREYLKKNFDWEYYGGHHLENKITAINHTVWFPKFGIDMRNLSLAAAARNGFMPREDAIKEYFFNSPHVDEKNMQYFLDRLNLTGEQWQEILNQPEKCYLDYKTYKPLFEFLRPLFYVLAKANLVPMSFYLKYTSKNKGI